MTSAIPPSPGNMIFDRRRVRHNRCRCAGHMEDYGFLFDRTAQDLADRLADIRRTWKNALRIGMRGNTGPLPNTENLFCMDLAPSLLARKTGVLADEEWLPFSEKSFDLVLTPLTLHSINDLPGTLVQIKQVLKPDGLFLASLFGGQTLHELRTALMDAELLLYGGASLRVAPFADLRDLAGLLQRTGFALPVADSEVVTVTYPHIYALLRDLRYMGEGTALAAASLRPAGRALFAAAADIYAQRFANMDGRLNATFEIVTLTGWAPDAVQQQPLRPGSAKHSLARALHSKEIPLT